MNAIFEISPSDFREAIANACEVTHTIDDPGKVADALVTFSQAKALDFKTAVVCGGRGSGKSFWWAALQKEDHRRWVIDSLGAKLSRADNLDVLPGFGVSPSLDKYPSPRILEILAKEHSSHLDDIWTTVLLRQTLPKRNSPYSALNTWAERVKWTASNIEKVEGLIQDITNELQKNNKHLLIAFDGLDRLASTWEETRPLARSILRFALNLQSFPRLRAKVFLRPDMFDDGQIFNFPDASKLLDGHASLDWSPVQLYALFFQRMANADHEPAAAAFRKAAILIIKNCGYSTEKWTKKGDVWELPLTMKTEPKVQREIFHAISGGTMSHNQNSVKRGYPYTWLPNHLADSHGEISPRSFLAALRQAAAIEPPSSSRSPLYFTGIQKGVSAASQTRVKEITEDFPWVGEVMAVLNGKINVPCEQSDVFNIWEADNTLFSILQSNNESTDEFSAKLGPTFSSRNQSEDIFEDLVRLGIFSRQEGSRIQMPDVYRVAFGIGRKGGIPPIRTMSNNSESSRARPSSR